MRRGGTELGLLIVLLLLAAWAVVLLPSLGSRRFASSPVNGVRSFEKVMGVLATTRTTGRVPGRWVMVPPEPTAGPRTRRSRVVRKRRLMLQRLLVAVGVTLLLGIFVKTFFLLNLVLDATLVLYVAQLRRWRMAEMRRARAARRLAETAGTVRVEQTAPEPDRYVALEEPDRYVSLNEPDRYIHLEEDEDTFERVAASFR